MCIAYNMETYVNLKPPRSSNSNQIQFPPHKRVTIIHVQLLDGSLGKTLRFTPCGRMKNVVHEFPATVF